MSDKCPKCGADTVGWTDRTKVQPVYDCGSIEESDKRPFNESEGCLRRQLAAATTRAEKAEAEVTRLRGLVEVAYREGHAMNRGYDEAQFPRMANADWVCSTAKRNLNAPATGEEKKR